MRIGSITFCDPFMRCTLKNNIFENFDEAAKLSNASDMIMFIIVENG